MNLISKMLFIWGEGEREGERERERERERDLNTLSIIIYNK